MRSYGTEPLGATHDRSSFECGSPPLDAYLKQYARQDRDRFMAQVYVRCAPTTNQVVGYYTLNAYAVLRGDLPPEAVRKLGRHTLIPAVLLGRLAIDRRWQGHGLGGLLLTDALRRAHRASLVVAAAVVIVQDKDGAAGFYEHHGFQPFQDEPNCLFLPLATMAKAVAALMDE